MLQVMKKNILFVCIENSNRSRMAEAFAITHGKEKIAAYSAGSKPSGKINPKAIAAMRGLGYDVESHHSKSVEAGADLEYDDVILMGCGDECAYVKARHHEDWVIPDP